MTNNFFLLTDDTIRKVAQNMPSSMLHSLSQVTNTTPQNQYTPGTHGGQSSYTVNTPYTPSGQTPYISKYFLSPSYRVSSLKI